MKKLLHYVLSVIVSAVCFFPVTDFQNINNKADSAETTEISDYSVEDLENLKNFLLCKETSYSDGKNYDLNNDGICDIFDLCLMKQQFFKESSSGNNILIAYFTRAENVFIENQEEIDTDATSSASLLPVGNSAIMADYIQSVVGGDLFSIVTENPYPVEYEDCLKRITEEQNENIRPVLKNHIDNMYDYDIIFIGYPNWAYTCPMAVFSFLEEYDFSGKTVIPFCTHGTGGLAGTVSDIKEILPENCEVMQPIGVYRENISDCKDDIEKWLSEIGF